MTAPGGAGVLAQALAGLLTKAQDGEQAPTVETEGELRASFEVGTPMGRYMVEVTELDE